MKTKQFRSILALAVVAASITTNLSPAQAFTWDELWGAVKTGVEKGFNNAAQSAAEQSNGSSQAAPEQNNYSEQSSSAPQQNNDSAQSSPTPIINCVTASGRTAYNTEGRSDSIVSVGRRAMKAHATVYIHPREPHTNTCSIDVHPSDEKFGLAFAIPDNSDLSNVRVTVYVDGQERISKIISRGQVGRYTIDVTGANSYAYTLQPLNDSGDIYFTY
jgi:hypothetical protein